MGWLRTLWVGWVVLICVSFFLRRFIYQFFPLWDALLVFVFCLTVRGVGEAVLKKLGCWKGSFLFRHVTALAAGFLPFSLGMFALGLFGGYRPAVAWVVLFLLALAVLPGTISFFSEAKAWGRHVRRSLDAPAAAWLALIGAASLGPLAASLVPSIYVDSLVLYLGFPWRYAVVGGLEFMPYNYWSFLPQNVEMLTTFLLLLHRSPFGPQLGSWAMGLVSAAAVYVLARQWLPRSWALCASALFYTTPTVLALGVFMKNDLFIGAAALVSLSTLCRWLRTGAARWMVLTGLLWGFWAGAKHPGVYALACGAATLVGYAIAAFLRPAEPGERSGRLKAVALGIAVAAAAASPWYVRNTVLTGNPFYPAYRHVFSAPEFQGHAYEMDVMHVEGAKQWLRLPWDMTMHRWYAGFPGNIGIWYLALLPPALFWLLWRRKIPQEFFWLLVYAVLLYGVWSLTFLRVRLILVAFGIGCVAIALGFRAWAQESRASKAVLALALAVGLPAHAWLHVSLEKVSGDFLEALRSPLSERMTGWLDEQWPYVPLVRALEGRLAPGEKVLTVGIPWLAYANVPMQTDGIYDKAALSEYIRTAHTLPQLVARLREEGFRYLLYGESNTEHWHERFDYLAFERPCKEQIFKDLLKASRLIERREDPEQWPAMRVMSLWRLPERVDENSEEAPCP